MIRSTQLMLSKGMGGAERYFVDLCLALAERANPVQAICHREFVARAELENHPNIECVPVRLLGAWDPFVRRAVLHQVQRFSPQVMQAHLARGAYIGGQVCSALELPLTVKTHNLVNLKYYRRVNHFIATTAAQKAYLEAHGIAAANISVIPNFSALPSVAEAPAPHTPLRFCSYGRMVKKKGFDILLRAFRAFLDSGHTASLSLGGDGEERAALEALSRSLGLAATVRFIGWVNEPATTLDACDVFVLPSLDEPFGIVLLEAMARGKAIIATRTHGPLEIFDDTAAWLVETGSTEQLARALIDAAEHPEISRRNAQTALTLYRQTYSADAVMPRIVALYDRLSRPSAVAG